VSLVEAPAPTNVVAGGEGAAWARLDAFLETVDDYHTARNLPGRDATSRLSVDLHFGALHPRQILAAIGAHTPGRAAFVRQLYWREFYADVLWSWPRSRHEALHPNHVALDEGPLAEERFVAWALGRTGFDLVDAGMRQLLEEGWMHNRARMLTASFLVKDLHLDWRWGAAWFAHRLADADVANNVHGWQWTAGVGTDASPFHRIFNPDVQAERFDLDGDYVRRYLGGRSDEQTTLFQIDGDGRESGARHPRIVDHARERTEALRRLAVARQRDTEGGPPTLSA
jgi:deoxyribodipyrimidine photo-lyase